MRKQSNFLKERHDSWLQHLSAWKQGGLKQSEYCRRHSLKYKSFTYWKKRLGFLQHPRLKSPSRTECNVKTDVVEKTVSVTNEANPLAVTFVPVPASHFSPKKSPTMDIGEISVLVGTRSAKRRAGTTRSMTICRR